MDALPEIRLPHVHIRAQFLSRFYATRSTRKALQKRLLERAASMHREKAHNAIFQNFLNDSPESAIHLRDTPAPRDLDFFRLFIGVNDQASFLSVSGKTPI